MAFANSEMFLKKFNACVGCINPITIRIVWKPFIPARFVANFPKRYGKKSDLYGGILLEKRMQVAIDDVNNVLSFPDAAGTLRPVEIISPGTQEKMSDGSGFHVFVYQPIFSDQFFGRTS